MAAAPPDAALLDRVGPALLLALAILLAIVAYAPGLSSPFLFDDLAFVRDNAALRTLWPPGWIHAGTQETRPLANLSFALDAAWSGVRPRGYHLTNLVLHLASVLLLFGLVRRTRIAAEPREPRPAAWLGAVAALLFAIHPAQSESVLYIQGRPGLLATAFGLGAMLAATFALDRWAVARGRTLRTAAVAGLAALAALSKESGAIVPALVLLYDALLVRPRDPRAFHRRLPRFHLPVWCGLLPLALAYGTLQNPHRGVFGPGVVDAAGFYATQPAVLLFYLRLYLWPAGFTVDHDFPLLSPADPGAWLAGAALLGLLAGVAWAVRHAPWSGFWSLWSLAALSPTSLIPGREFVAERYLTLATPAAAALAALALARLPLVIPRRARGPQPVLVVGLALALALPLAWATHGRAELWRSDLALWREAARLSPAKPRPWYQYARLLAQADSLDGAERATRRALTLGARSHLPLLLLSGIKASAGQLDSSLFYAGEAVRLEPEHAEPYVGLAYALSRLERWDGVRRAAETALRLDPASSAALYLRGRARAESDDLDGARRDADSLAARRTQGVEAAALMGLVELRAGRAPSADAWLARATTTPPGDQDGMRAYADALRARGFVLFEAGRAEEAVRAWTRYFTATGADRWDATSLFSTALAFRALGQEREAAWALVTVTRLQPGAARAWIELAHLLATSRDPAVRDRAAAQRALGRGVALADLRNPAAEAKVAEVRAALDQQR